MKLPAASCRVPDSELSGIVAKANKDQDPFKADLNL